MVFNPAERYLQNRCTGCGICSSICPTCSIRATPEGKPSYFAHTCIGCSHCGVYCPENCFDLEPAAGSEGVSPVQVDELFKLRRSVRRFKAADLSADELEELLKPLNWTPTGRNDQGITVKVLSGRAAVEEKLVNKFTGILRAVDCFRAVTLMAGPGRDFIRRLRKGEDLLAWGAPCVLLFSSSVKSATPVQDSLIAASAVAMKAEAMGLGTLWGGFIRYAAPLTGLGRCHTALCVGQPVLRKYQMAPERKWKRIDIHGRQGS
ncbi:hypothetical protein CSA37_12680 [Candidatus Fermentibacteria bacterium]|nr:MAG: hypothetical protein CSA37_12680 [Candidatus Fermentibacteria bacterium]